MLNGIRKSACELLLSNTDSDTAELLGIKLSTLHKWMNEPEFKKALRQLEKNQSKSLARLSRQTALMSSAYLCRAISEQCKIDAKVLLDIIKASGAFDQTAQSAESALADVVSAISERQQCNDES